MREGVLRRPMAIAAALAMYGIAIYLTRRLMTPDQRVLAWFPSGVMAFALTFCRRENMPWIIGGALIVSAINVSSFGLSGNDLWVAVGALAVTWIVAASILRRGGRPEALLDTPQGLVRLVVASIAGGVTAIAVGAALLPLTTIRLVSVRETYEAWAVAFALGIFLPMAAGVAWRRGVHRDRKMFARAVLGSVAGVLLVLPSWLSSDGVASATTSFLTTLAVALLVWVSVMVGRRGTMLVMLSFFFTTSWFLHQGRLSSSQRGLTLGEVVSTSQITYFGLTVGLLLVTIVLRERRVANQIGAEQAAEMQVIRDAVLDAIITIDYEYTIISTNRAGLVLIGNSEGVGTSFLSYLSEESAAWVSTGLRPDITPDDERSLLGKLVEFTITPRSAPEVLTEASLVEHEVGGKRFVTLVLRDVTERKAVENELRRFANELERSNHDLAEFAYVASHDLQEPLRMVSFYVRLLADRYAGQLDDDADEYIHFASDGAERMQALVHDLLTYSRAGTAAVDAAMVPSQDAAVDAIALLRGAIDRTKAEVVAEGLPEVFANRVLLVQVFQNLLGNALKFCEGKEPKIRIWAERWGDAWCITVEDNGIGIPEEQRDRIFQPFRRLQSRQKFEGNGIGLAVCKKIIDRHGGRIWVEAAPSGGSLFRFTIPGALRKTA